MYSHTKFKSLITSNDNRYPFVVDQEETLKINGIYLLLLII